MPCLQGTTSPSPVCLQRPLQRQMRNRGMRVMDRVKERPILFSGAMARHPRRQEDADPSRAQGAAARHRADAGGQGRRRVGRSHAARTGAEGHGLPLQVREARRPSVGARNMVLRSWCPIGGKCSTPRRLRALPSRQWPGRAGNHRCQIMAPVDSAMPRLFTHPAGDRRRPCRVVERHQRSRCNDRGAELVLVPPAMADRARR